MDVETYPSFFTPRDKELNLSSSEEKSSKFDWLEIKIKRKQKYIWKTEQVLCRYISCKTVQKDLSPLKNKLPRDIYKENYKISIRGYSSLSPNLITKESYNWWVTRRFWGFRQQISKAKYLKISIAKYLQVSVAYIWKLQENTAALCRNGCKTPRVNAIRRSGYAWPGKLKRLLSHPASSAGCETSGWNVPDVRHPGGMAARSPIRMKVPDVRHLGGMCDATRGKRVVCVCKV